MESSPSNFDPVEKIHGRESEPAIVEHQSFINNRPGRNFLWPAWLMLTLVFPLPHCLVSCQLVLGPPEPIKEETRAWRLHPNTRNQAMGMLEVTCVPAIMEETLIREYTVNLPTLHICGFYPTGALP